MSSTTFPHGHRPMPRGLLVLAATIALIEIVLSAADAGYLADPSLRQRVFVAGAFWPSLLHGDVPLYAVQPATMFLSHAFLHGSLLHMAMNLTILLALGRFAADRYGASVVLPLFAVSAVAGAAVFGLLNHDQVPMVGASGAVFGFLGVWIAWDWRRHRDAGLSTGPVLRRVVVLALLNVAMWFALSGGLAWEAHLGGFIVGALAGAWLERRVARIAFAERAERRRLRREAQGGRE